MSIKKIWDKLFKNHRALMVLPNHQLQKVARDSMILPAASWPAKMNNRASPT